MSIKKPDNWDGKWRLILFDISNNKKGKRDFMRKKLVEMGFYSMQESVYVYPYPCEKEIKFLREVLNIPHDVKMLRADRIENDEDLRKIFNL